ncbi:MULTISPECIES: YgiQ family radical SAM protein [unclassified Oceanobacter]|uniref:YgiQ family radical SAM protein n=1 Tax=unclassified Oceanobacter TaxID=2620260 RepID=UPI0027369BEA|nr:MULTISPECIES: YgiQ family radical SAM protein [unclassified Oceanobacter]MDP2610336.1 YgiQ family radical SAM protein [Oceanobacter sp. 1_MG-2023]MDP2613713.1 YgiQ family radical SAM protein [Oceanobacter sp. 2_MG-2023]
MSQSNQQPVTTEVPHLFSHFPYWAECFGTAPFLPTTREEMDQLGWDSCDIIVVCGDAYVDHPSFGMAVIGRLLESQGFRVGLICQPDWNDPDAFTCLGQPNFYFGVSAGNMDSMINRYTADLKVRSEDAYTPGGEPGKRPDRAVIVYSQKIREVYKDIPIVIGGIEASLRRIAQYDYWSDQVRRSVLIDSGADILLYGNAERALVDLTHKLAEGRDIKDIIDLRGTAILRDAAPQGWTEIDSTRIDWPGKIDVIANPYEMKEANSDSCASDQQALEAGADADTDIMPVKIVPMPLQRKVEHDNSRTYIRLPSFDKVRNDSALYAHASRVLHQESNPYNAHPLMQKHGTQEVWVNPPPIPLETDEMDAVFALPYQRIPHPAYGDARIPAYDMIRFSVNIMRGCFGGCTFCSITEHEGRIIQSRSQESIIHEIEEIRDKVPGFTGTISDLGGPTANMYMLNCKSETILKNCRRLSCVYPGICKNLKTSHKPTTELYRAARALPGVKRIAIASGLRYDLAVEDPEYVRELVTHHVGGLLKIAPEHTEKNVLTKMMKPGMGTYDNFKRMFDKFSKEAGKEQYLVPYFIAAHPGTENSDMMNLARWLKSQKMRVDQVQTFYPSPMSLATAMYHSERNPLQRMSYKTAKMTIPRDIEQRRLQKAFLRYHDERNWPMLREELKRMGRHDLIGKGPDALIPAEDAPSGSRQRPGYHAKGRGVQGKATKAPVAQKADSGNNKARSQGAAAKKAKGVVSGKAAGAGKGSAGKAPFAKRVRKLK